MAVGESFNTAKFQIKNIASRFESNTRRLSFARAFILKIIESYWNNLNLQSDLKLRPLFKEVKIMEIGSPEIKMASDIAKSVSSMDIAESGYHIGRLYTILIPEEMRSRDGVFYTPPLISRRLIDISENAGADWRRHKVLDPACGGGGILAPLAERMIASLNDLSIDEIIRHLSAHLHGYEIDPFAAWISQVFIDLIVINKLPDIKNRPPRLVKVKDYLRRRPERSKYDIIIGNPPYGRVKLISEKRQQFERSLYGHANQYALFMDQSLWYLKESGIISLIKPTSFMGGRYFKKLRSLVRTETTLRSNDFISVRSGVFDDVLQETVITCFQKVKLPETKPSFVNMIQVNGASSINVINVGRITIGDNHETPWIIPRSPKDVEFVNRLNGMTSRLGDYGYKVSTGPLVWNRHKSQLRINCGRGCYPLIWAESVGPSGIFKYQATRKNHTSYYEPVESESWLLLKTPCILVKRTTSKEQDRRIFAAELPASFIESYGAVVVENHLNMILPRNGNPAISIKTLMALFGSDAYDRSLRCMNGSVAVSAYEIESLPLPSIKEMTRIENLIASESSKEMIDEEIERLYR